MTPVGFEPALPAREQQQNYRAAIVIGLSGTALLYSFRLSVFKTLRTETSATEIYRINGSLGNTCSWFRLYMQRFGVSDRLHRFQNGRYSIRVKRGQNSTLLLAIPNTQFSSEIEVEKMSHLAADLQLFYNCILQNRLLIFCRLNLYFEHCNVHFQLNLCNVHARYSLGGTN
jgi:hypothetical protein